MNRAIVLLFIFITSCAPEVSVMDAPEESAPLADCEVSSDCPEPPPEACRSVACDWTGVRTEPGYPRGCFLVVKASDAYCYFKIGPYTCPGTCSGPESGSVCQNMTPHCGDYH